jgi:hypothetical protein
MTMELRATVLCDPMAGDRVDPVPWLAYLL